jgi:hypothetical protein
VAGLAATGPAGGHTADLATLPKLQVAALRCTLYDALLQAGLGTKRNSVGAGQDVVGGLGRHRHCGTVTGLWRRALTPTC